jgi:hypothetical protein
MPGAAVAGDMTMSLTEPFMNGHPKAKRAYAWSHLDGAKDEAGTIRGRAGNPARGVSRDSGAGSNRQGC